MRLEAQRQAGVVVAQRPGEQALLGGGHRRPDAFPSLSVGRIGSEARAGPARALPTQLLDHCTRMKRQMHSISIPHVQQRHNWDCGLACVLMVLRTFGITSYTLQLLQELCSTRSIWTIDLAHLLRYFGMNVTFLTTTFGANPDYASETFYREHIEEDEQRVGRLFQEAQGKGIQLHQCSLNVQQLQAVVVSGCFILILLVDKRKLSPSSRPSALLHGATVRSAALAAKGYTGHYIVISGFDAGKQEYTVCDPALPSRHTTISVAALEAARQSFGTDEDTLLVSRDSYHCCGAPVRLWEDSKCDCSANGRLVSRPELS